MSVDFKTERGGVARGSAWMLFILVLLFWLPLLGPLLAGAVGGKKSGGVGSAIAAVFLPCVILAGFLFLYSTALTGLPLFGFMVGAGSFLLLAGNVGPLLVGAIVGGLMAR
ncbi:MAG: hypothetical protein AB1916_13820 [Thermodesulfobacteriota bacterium]